MDERLDDARDPLWSVMDAEEPLSNAAIDAMARLLLTLADSTQEEENTCSVER